MRSTHVDNAEARAANVSEAAEGRLVRQEPATRRAADRAARPVGWTRVLLRRPFILAGLGLALAVGVLLATAPDRRPHTAATSVPGAVTVGAPGPTVACTTTVDVGASLEAALAGAAPGSVVCLNGGHWPDPQLSGVDPSRNVTIAAAPGQAVYMTGLTMTGPGAVGNLTFQGIRFTAGVRGVGAITGGLVFKYNTLENIRDTYAFYFYGNANGDQGLQSGVSIRYNQIDHVGQCLELVGGARMESDFTFAHNVCGPGIGYGEDRSFGAHYIQTDGVRRLTVDNNAFEGPPDPRTVTYGNHLNVLHVWGTAQNVDFSNNIIWHTRTIGQMVLLGDNSYPSLLDNVTLSNNLDVADPACGPGSACQSYSMYSFPAHGMTWTHNTIIGSVWGVGLGWVASCTSTCYRSSTNMIGALNIAAPSCGRNPDCNENYAAFACGGGRCVVDHNVSGDGSANSALGGTNNVVGWPPKFRTTSWTPTSGSPWRHPPASYYQPVGLPFAAGYQGAIGP